MLLCIYELGFYEPGAWFYPVLYGTGWATYEFHLAQASAALPVAAQFLFMLNQLPVELVCQRINGRVHIQFRGVSEQVFAIHMYYSIGFLVQFDHGQGHMNAGN